MKAGRIKRTALALLAGVLLFGSITMRAEAAEDFGDCSDSSGQQIELLVFYRENAGEKEKQEVLLDAGVDESAVTAEYPGLHTCLICVDADRQQDVMRRMEKNPDVALVQCNQKIILKEKYHSLQEIRSGWEKRCKMPFFNFGKQEITVNDSLYSLQWGLENTGQTVYQEGIAGIDANVRKAWSITTGSKEVLVGVLDAGMDLIHVDLTTNIYVNKNEVPGNGIDDDNNGYIDDICGWDFYHNDNMAYDSYEEDTHGTYVASILGAPLNDIGMVGVCPEVSIVPLKFMSTLEGGDTDKAVEAIEYAKQLGVKIINCSWRTKEYNPALREAMRRSGILFVCAAGNDGVNIDFSPVYPACFGLSNIITVGAIDSRGEVSSYSNYGRFSVDVMAPGDGVVGAFPGSIFYASEGTSAACPFVAGEAALLYSVNPRMTPRLAKQYILQSVTRDSRYAKTKTGGRIDVYKAVRAAKLAQILFH